MKVLFLEGSNQYGVVDFFLSGIKTDLASMGFECESLSFAKEHQQSALEAIANGIEHDIVFSFNGIGLDVKNDQGKGFFESSGKPVFIFLVDHPLHLITRFLGTPATVLCVDEEHVSFCQLCGMKARFFPHAISESQIPPDASVLEDKVLDYLFPVSYFDLSHWQAKLKPVWHQVEPLLNQVNNITRFLQLIGVLPLGERPATVALDQNILSISRFVDFYFRARSRENALALAENLGVSLTVVGNNSAKYQDKFASHVYRDAVSFDDLQQLIKASKYVLHNSPGFERGLHERLVLPMALSTMPTVTDEPFGKHLFGQPAEIPKLADSVAISNTEYVSGIQQNLALVKEGHTWRSRLETLFRQESLIR